MTKVSKSPERFTFQRDAYLERCKESGKDPSPAYLDMFEGLRASSEQYGQNPEQHENDMEYDMRTSAWLCEKVRNSDAYAQNLYAAMCNTEWQKREVMLILKDETWSCTWRSAGGIVANLREQGDYIDWYCSGIGDGLGNGDVDGVKGYVPEGTVTEEIADDLYKLGWVCKEDNGDQHG
jgi:hypothetical protein